MKKLFILISLLFLSVYSYSAETIVEKLDKQLESTLGYNDQIDLIIKTKELAKSKKNLVAYSEILFREGELEFSAKNYEKAKVAYEESSKYYSAASYNMLSYLYSSGLGVKNKDIKMSLIYKIFAYDIYSITASEQMNKVVLNNLKALRSEVLSLYLTNKKIFLQDDYSTLYIRGFLSEFCVVGYDDNEPKDYIPCDTKTAYKFYSKGLDLAIKQNNETYKKIFYYKLGTIVYNFNSEYSDISKKYETKSMNSLLEQAIELYTKSSNPFAMLKLGVIYAENKDFEKSKECFGKAYGLGMVSEATYYYYKYKIEFDKIK